MPKNILTPLGINCGFSNWCRSSKKKKHGSGATTLIISNEEMNDIMKTVQALEDFNIVLKGVTKTSKNETKEQKGEFLGMLLNTLGARLLGNVLAGKGIVRTGYGSKKNSDSTSSFNKLWNSKILSKRT